MPLIIVPPEITRSNNLLLHRSAIFRTEPSWNQLFLDIYLQVPIGNKLYFYSTRNNNYTPLYTLRRAIVVVKQRWSVIAWVTKNV
jgi:hypothetical protein